MTSIREKHRAYQLQLLAESARDTVAAQLRAGSGIVLANDDAADTLTISSTAIRSMWRPGAVIRPPGGTGTGTALNGAQRACPFFVPRNNGTPWTITNLYCEVTTVPSPTTAIYRFGVWGPSATDLWHPGALIFGDTTGPALDSTGIKERAGLSISIPDDIGVIWVGGAVQGATTTAPVMRSPSAPPWSVPSDDWSSTNLAAVGIARTGTDITADLVDFPGPAGCSAASGIVRVHFKLAA